MFHINLAVDKLFYYHLFKSNIYIFSFWLITFSELEVLSKKCFRKTFSWNGDADTSLVPKQQALPEATRQQAGVNQKGAVYVVRVLC